MGISLAILQCICGLASRVKNHSRKRPNITRTWSPRKTFFERICPVSFGWLAQKRGSHLCIVQRVAQEVQNMNRADRQANAHFATLCRCQSKYICRASSNVYME